MLFLFLVLNAAVAEGYYEEYSGEQAYTDYRDETTKSASLRVRRYEPETNTFDPDDEDQVKGALNQIFSGRKFDDPLTPNDFISFLDVGYNNSLSPITRINEALTLVKNWQRTTNLYHPASKVSEEILEDIYRNATGLYQFFTQPVTEIKLNDINNPLPTKAYIADQLVSSQAPVELRTDAPAAAGSSAPPQGYITKKEPTPTQNPVDFRMDVPANVANLLPPARGYIDQQVLPFRSPSPIELRSNFSAGVANLITPTREEFVQVLPSRSQAPEDLTSLPTNGSEYEYLRQEGDYNTNITDLIENEEIGTGDPLAAVARAPKAKPKGKPKPITTPPPTTLRPLFPPAGVDMDQWTCIPKTPPPTTTTTKKTTRHFDIDKFLEIVANLTFDYYTNLTAQVNETLRKMSMMPTCPTLTPAPTDFDYMIYNDSLRGKCFVCGMEKRGIPRDADCADAFAGDFIPLVPQNPKAKAHIARYRMYCAFRDVNNFIINKTMPRMMWGRWTGGCAVRWTDLTGVYTQRTCRSKYKAAVGKHYASKRMAKLEMTLVHMDNGCIISPVATLLPLSRGISLFARVHACVCTGSWCNGSTPLLPIAVSALVAMVTSLLTFK